MLILSCLANIILIVFALMETAIVLPQPLSCDTTVDVFKSCRYEQAKDGSATYDGDL